jgi:hypothetical protein
MRILELVNQSILIDILTSEENIEKLINNTTIDTNTKLVSIKNELNLIVNAQLMQAKWVDLCGSMSNVNNEKSNKSENNE